MAMTDALYYNYV